MTQAYPLAWPQGRPRRRPQDRKPGKFGKGERRYVGDHSYTTKSSLTVADAIRRLQDELDRLGARLPVISSNVELRLDGLPRSGQREPEDPGVCVYFQLAGKPHAMPCDTYDRVADNIDAVAEHIKATRAIDRYGVASIADLVTAARRELASGTAWRARQVRARRMDKARADRETAELQAILGRLLIARDAGLEILAADAEGLAVLHPDGQVRRYALVPAAADTPALTKESVDA